MMLEEDVLYFVKLVYEASTGNLHTNQKFNQKFQCNVQEHYFWYIFFELIFKCYVNF